jgi:asparagine synthase (glutamine-hydrolysing)
MAKAIYPNRSFECFTIKNKTDHVEGFSDDLKFARLAANRLNVKLEEVPSTNQLLENLDHLVYHMDEPIGDPASLHVLSISRHAKNLGYKVLMSGTGCDELFSGYRRHQAVYFTQFGKFIPISLIKGLNTLVNLFSPSNPKVRRLNKVLNQLNLDSADQFIGYHSWLPVEIAKDLFSKELKEQLKDYHPFTFYRTLLTNLTPHTDGLNKMLYLDMKAYLPDNNLLYMDKMGMSEGVEIRVPFLDNEVVEFSSTLPNLLKMKGLTTKYLVRQVAKKYLPEEIIRRSKTGFGAPVRSMIKQNSEAVLRIILNPVTNKNVEIFDPTKIKELISANEVGKIDGSYSILAILAILSWKNQFVK